MINKILVVVFVAENSCFKFPFVVCFYSLGTRRKLALMSLWRFLPFLRSFCSEGQQSYLFSKGLLELCVAPLR